MPRCSIIIPVYNNATVLPRALQALWQQEIPPRWEGEVILSDDGSTDSSRAIAQNTPVPKGWRLHLVTQSHAGAAAARNQALRRARGEIILFLGADIVLRPGALAAHLSFHDTHPETEAAALGFIAWDPQLPPSRLMIWMMHGGHHNNYDALLGVKYADPQHFFYGAFVSVKKALVGTDGFATAFQEYGWEDFEFGLRLKERGLRLHILARARALHVHYYSVADVCRRQYAAGRGIHTYQKLHPGVALMPAPTSFQQFKHQLAFILAAPIILRLLTTFLERYSTFPRLFQLLTTVYFWQGWHQPQKVSGST